MGRAAAKIARWLSFKKAEPKKADPVVTRPKRLKGAKSPRRRRKKGNECVDTPASVAKTYAEKTEAVSDVDAEEKMRGVNVETGSKVDAVSTDNVALNMEDWAPLGVHALIVKALKSRGFRSPTSIQREVVPLAIHERCDIVGAAETGSGKTLAFAIPILHHILTHCHIPLAGAKRKRKRSGEEEGAIVDLNCVVCGDKGRKSGDKGVKAKVVRHDSNVEDTEKMGTDGEGGDDGEDGEGGDDGEDGEDGGGDVEDSDNLDLDDSNEDDLDLDEGGDDDDLDLDEGGDDDDLDLDEGGDDLDLDEGGDDDDLDLDEGGDDLDLDEGGDDDGDLDGDDEDIDLEGEEVPCAELVEVRDNIPDDEFEAMVRGDENPQQGKEEPSMLLCSGEGGGGEEKDLLVALILVPTRELALQVYAHIKDAAKYTSIRACVLVGGMATEKQDRLLSQRPSIVIATPGRLWKMMSEGHHHLTSLNGLRFLVLDEADRMIEYGHFKELTLILERVNGMERHSQRQTFVFSATLTLPRKSLEKKSHKKPVSGEETVEQLMSRIGLREDMKLVDLTMKKGTAEGLVETRIMCSDEEKDVHLYYFILTYPGRTLVFVNSIDSVHRLKGILELLRIKPYVLHAHLQQRQRLKNLEGFIANREGVMIASDVAARGLDIPHVQHVIHYQVPRNSELYVHRSGRTARAKEEGISVVFVGPHDLASYRNICRTLNRDQDLPTFPLDSSYLRGLRDRVGLARRIEREDHKAKRVQQGNNWFVQQAKAMDIELDEDLLQDTTSSSGASNVASMKAQLDTLLKAKVLPSTMSSAYPTQDHRLVQKTQAGDKGESPRLMTSFDGPNALTVAKHARQKVTKT